MLEREQDTMALIPALKQKDLEDSHNCVSRKSLTALPIYFHFHFHSRGAGHTIRRYCEGCHIGVKAKERHVVEKQQEALIPNGVPGCRAHGRRHYACEGYTDPSEGLIMTPIKWPVIIDSNSNSDATEEWQEHTSL